MERLQETIDLFANKLVTHLHAEIETLINLQKHYPDCQEVKRLYLLTEKAANAVWIGKWTPYQGLLRGSAVRASRFFYQ